MREHQTQLFENYWEGEGRILPMLDSLPRWLYCCLTEALRAAVASMAEFDLPGVEWRGEPLLMEATENTRLAQLGGSDTDNLVVSVLLLS